MAEEKKNPAAVALGRLGGKKRAATLSAEDLSAQGKKAAAARWAKARPVEPVNGGGESPISARREPVVEAKPEAVSRVEATLEGRDSNAMLALREQGYEVGEPATHPDGVTRVAVRSHDVSAWVTTGTELLDLAAGRVMLDAIVSRRHRSAAAAG